jgi:periplasmic protein CpxP/Spy
MKKLSLIAALAIGGLLACCTLTNAQDSKPKHSKGGMTVDQRMEMMSKNLSLTDDQKPKVKAVLEDSDKKMKALSSEDRQGDKGKEVRKEEREKLKEILTPEQQAKMRESGKSSGRKKKDQ